MFPRFPMGKLLPYYPLYTISTSRYIVCSMKGANRHRHPPAGDEEGENLADPRRLRIRIAYMHCKGCAATIEGSLRRRPGVLEASVDYAKGEGCILYDASKTSPDSLLSDSVFEEPSPFEAEVLQDQEA